MKVAQGVKDVCYICKAPVIWRNRGTFVFLPEAAIIDEALPGQEAPTDLEKSLEQYLRERWPGANYGDANYYSDEGRANRRAAVKERDEWEKMWTSQHGWYHLTEPKERHNAVPSRHCGEWTQKSEYCNIKVADVVGDQPRCGIHIGYLRREQEQNERINQERELRAWEQAERHKQYEIEEAERRVKREAERLEREAAEAKFKAEHDGDLETLRALTGLDFQYEEARMWDQRGKETKVLIEIKDILALLERRPLRKERTSK